MAYLSFTFDHRVLDGQGADGFLAAVKQFLEDYADELCEPRDRVTRIRSAPARRIV